jgi:hypothetical protein
VKGQALVIVILVILALAAMFTLAVNGAYVIVDSRAVARAAEDAAMSGLRTGRAGESAINPTLADREARRVLGVELANARNLAETPDQAAAGASVVTDISGVSVSVAVRICPPLWQCVPYSVSRTAALETPPHTLETATPIPPLPVFIVPTPTP